ncbi:unnamed protein product [Phytomonas sp. Hart1]|nr:unnamed protein product [Phytomonas sp. Hart1]|eukprot:CCW70331.1 unnamed protein product [Phytomonas sp. isolate Hart1]
MHVNNKSGVQTAPSTSASSRTSLPAYAHEVFSRASPSLVKIRVDQLLPFTTQRAQQRIEAQKKIFATTPLTALQAAHKRGIRDVVQRLRITKSVRNVKVHHTASAAGPHPRDALPQNNGVVGSLCMPLTTCCPVPVSPSVGPDPNGHRASSALGLTGAVDGLVTLWDVDTHRPLASAAAFKGNQWARVRALEAHPTEPIFFTATMFDRTVSAWRISYTNNDLTVNEEERKGGGEGLSLERITPSAATEEEGAHVAGINRIAVDPSGAVLASTGDDATLRLWDVRHWGQVLMIQDGYEGARGVLGVAFHPDGALLATTDRGGRVVAWDTRTGHHAFTTAGHSGGHLARATCVAWSPCGIRFASGGADAVIHLFDARMLYRKQQALSAVKRSNSSSAAPFAFLGHEDVVSSVSFYANPYPDGRGGASTGASPLLPLALVSTSLDHTMRFWDMDTGLCVHTLDAGVPLYAHCRPFRAAAGAKKQGENSEACSSAAILGVGHSKYWFLWDVVSALHEETFKAVIKDTDSAAAVHHLEGLLSEQGYTPYGSEALGTKHIDNIEENDDDEEMLYLMRKPDNAKMGTIGGKKEDNFKDNNESSDDEMALLRK